MQPIKLKCNAIHYRKGFIEIWPGIHEGCINIEAWDIDSNLDISELEFAHVPESAITGNTELELDLKTAQALVDALQSAIKGLS